MNVILIVCDGSCSSYHICRPECVLGIRVQNGLQCCCSKSQVENFRNNLLLIKSVSHLFLPHCVPTSQLFLPHFVPASHLFLPRCVPTSQLFLPHCVPASQHSCLAAVPTSLHSCQAAVPTSLRSCLAAVMSHCIPASLHCCLAAVPILQLFLPHCCSCLTAAAD